MTTLPRPRILSGMRPTGPLHIGHLVGALENWVRLQSTHECFFAIVDWHALTTDYADPSRIRANVREIALDWLAAGIDPERSDVFVQSAVKEHAELHLLLSMIVPLGWLERVPTYKDQQEQLKETRDLHTYGFLGYPLLQAADILAYKAGFVPVGEDQVPHLEMCREIARRFNNLYGGIFPEPQALLTSTPRVPGLDGRKMSKSFGNAVFLGENPADIDEKILRRMVTDPARKRRNDPGNPDVCPVFDLHKVFSSPEERSWADAGCRSAGIGCVECKSVLLGNLHARLAPLLARRAELEKDPQAVDAILFRGAAKAREVAASTLAEVRSAMGLG
jgi:tryptophanyl-tRNA synthetase